MAGPQFEIEFWCSQMKEARKNPKGHMWTTKEKVLALNLFHACPICYRLLRKTCEVPSIRTLQNLTSNVNLHPGFTQAIMNAIIRKLRKCLLLINTVNCGFKKIVRISTQQNKKWDRFQGQPTFPKMV